jgi:hypothetical protein
VTGQECAKLVRRASGKAGINLVYTGIFPWSIRILVVSIYLFMHVSISDAKRFRQTSGSVACALFYAGAAYSL